MKKTVLLCLVLLVGFGKEASAQNSVGQLLKDTAKDVVLDPTTYVPGALHFTATKLDWDTSQVFFRNGYVEKNPDFTISGKGYDIPLSYSAGNRRIVVQALPVFGLSFLNNAGAGMSKKILTNHYPQHKKLIKWICQIEKMATASYLSYIKSVPSFNQWQENKKIVIELNLK